MSKAFSFTTEFEHSVDTVHAALTSEDYWKSRIGADSDGSSIAVSAPAGPGTIRVEITGRMDPAGLPAVVRGILRGPLEMNRVDEWSALDGDHAQGAMTGGSSSLPVTIEGRSELRPSASGGSVVEVTGEVAVKIPVVGGQVEGLVVQMVESIVNGDQKELNDWLAAK